jgi:hypothetical protein
LPILCLHRRPIMFMLQPLPRSSPHLLGRRHRMRRCGQKISSGARGGIGMRNHGRDMLFLICSNLLDSMLAMTDIPPLRVASPEEIAEILSFALRYDGRRQVHDAAEVMARTTAERLVRHLQQSGFVIMNSSTPTPIAPLPLSLDRPVTP